MATSKQDSAPPERGEPQLDVSIVIQAKAGDEGAFDRLYLRYFHLIAIFLIHLVGDEETGYDLAQNTFVRAWRSLGQLKQPEAFLGWLYQIARNIALDHLRKIKDIYSVSLAPEHEYIEDKKCTGPEEQTIATDQIKCALAAISQEKYRAALIFSVAYSGSDSAL